MDYTPYKFEYFPKERVKLSPNYVNRKGYIYPVLVVVIMLSLVVSLLVGSRIMEQDLIGELVKNLGGKDTLNYYVVCLNPLDFKGDAEGVSKAVTLSGGAGYIITKDNKYFVSLATYLSENEAKEVVQKNENTTYLTLTFDRREFLRKTTDDGTIKKVLEGVEEAIISLTETVTLYEKREINLVDATHRVERVEGSLINLKMELLESKSTSKEKLLTFLEPFLTLLPQAREKGNFSGGIRAVVCIVVDRMGTLF